MNLGELRSVQNGERSTDSLQHLRETFYEDVAAYVEGLREERRAAASEADDPFDSTTVRRLTDEIKTAEEVVEAIYERRVGKIVKRASIKAAGMPTDEDEGLTKEEATLFNDLVARIQQNKETVLEILGGAGVPDDHGERSASSASDATTGDDPATVDPVEAQVAASAVGQEEPPAGAGQTAEQSTQSDGDQGATDGSDEAEPADQADDTDRTTVRITQDVGEIFGVDEREYVLEAEDVVALPTQNAEPLVAREAAEKLD